MKCGICARCKRRSRCRFRQKGTWVNECERFVEDPQRTRTDRRAEPGRRGPVGLANSD